MSDFSSDSILGQSEARRALRARQVEANKERARTASTIQANIDATSASAWSRGREVKVTVAANGLLQNVEYAEKADGMNASTLAALTLTTIRQAMAEVQAKIDEIVEVAAPASADAAGVAAQIRASYHDTFAESLSHLEPEPPVR